MGIVILCLLLLIGILKGITRYGALILVLLLQASLGLLSERRGKQKLFGKGQLAGNLLINSMIFLLALFPAFFVSSI